MTSIGFAQVSDHQFTEKNKALRVQVVSAESDDGTTKEVNFADAFGPWCLIAVPDAREVDAKGNVTGACEALVADMPDQRVPLGYRDVRIAKYGQDLKAGEFAFVNSKGYRLAFKKDEVSLACGGGFLTFNATKKTVGLVGIPALPGGGAPYLSIDSTSIGLVSATGAASVTVSANGVTASGAFFALDVGRVDLGKGASDPVVTYSVLMSVIAQIVTQMNTHFALPAHTPGVPFVLAAKPGARVFAPLGG